jgi:hypothetical protein
MWLPESERRVLVLSSCDEVNSFTLMSRYVSNSMSLAWIPTSSEQ